MADMFGRETILGGVMSAETTKLTFTNEATLQAGLIMQQVNIQYAQNITRLYALEDAKVYFVAGRTDGNLTIQHVIGPAGLQAQFISTYGNVCNIGNKVFNLTMASGCSTSADVSTVRLKCPVITAVSVQMQAQNMIIGSGITAMFVSMDLVGGGTGTTTLSTASIGGGTFV